MINLYENYKLPAVPEILILGAYHLSYRNRISLQGFILLHSWQQQKTENNQSTHPQGGLNKLWCIHLIKNCAALKEQEVLNVLIISSRCALLIPILIRNGQTTICCHLCNILACICLQNHQEEQEARALLPVKEAAGQDWYLDHLMYLKGSFEWNDALKI